MPRDDRDCLFTVGALFGLGLLLWLLGGCAPRQGAIPPSPTPLVQLEKMDSPTLAKRSEANVAENRQIASILDKRQEAAIRRKLVWGLVGCIGGAVLCVLVVFYLPTFRAYAVKGLMANGVLAVLDLVAIYLLPYRVLITWSAAALVFGAGAYLLYSRRNREKALKACVVGIEEYKASGNGRNVAEYVEDAAHRLDIFNQLDALVQKWTAKRGK